MWPFRRKPHLRYSSLEAWCKGEGLTEPIHRIADPVERDRRLQEYAQLRRHLFARHLRTLSRDERREFSAGTHPSQSHRFAERAEPFAKAFEDHLASLGIVASVGIGRYHLDRIVLWAELRCDPGARRSTLPWLFRGFEVKYAAPSDDPASRP